MQPFNHLLRDITGLIARRSIVYVSVCLTSLAPLSLPIHASQNIVGHGNNAIHGDHNTLGTRTHISGETNISSDSRNIGDHSYTDYYDSKAACEDLAKGQHGRIVFEDKDKSVLPRSSKKRVLILTATNYETKVIQEEAQKAGLKIEREIINDQVVYHLGALGGIDIIHMQPSMMGMLEPGSTPLVLMSVFKDVHPDYIIATGIAFGRESKGHKLGDILISRQLVNYESRKESNGDIYFRGDKVTSPMLGRINSAVHNWQGPSIQQGVVLSGNALVNSKEFLEYLSKKEPEYVGGDMESYGVYAVSSMMGAQWIMIKGISDWGDGSKNDNFHKAALENVGKFIFYAIGQGCLKS